jgi:hypothetical protein
LFIRFSIKPIGIAMDNIQKSIAAVLGVAAFVTLLIPSADGTSSNAAPQVPPPAATVEAKVPPPSNPQPADSDNGNANDDNASQDDGSDGEADEYAEFGQPMNDAAPLGSGSDQSGGYPKEAPGSGYTGFGAQAIAGSATPSPNAPTTPQRTGPPVAD